ncbi:MAG: sulfotransferase [Cellvibrionaceae bacterium]
MVTSSSSVCFSFVCQSGELELKALLLAASIRLFKENDCFELVAAVPDPALWGDIRPKTRRLLADLNVRVEEISSPFGREYPIGNKLSAIGVTTQSEVTVFLDSDILCLKPISVDLCRAGGLSAKPADLNTFTYDINQWEYIYQLFGSGLPEGRVLSTVSEELMLPYFNAGVVAVKNGQFFSSEWIQVAKVIDEDEKILNKRPWLDQVALPVTAKTQGMQIESLPESMNYPAHLKPVLDGDMPFLCHYHWPKIIKGEPSLLKLLGELCSKFPYLANLMREYSSWESILSVLPLAKSRFIPFFRSINNPRKESRVSNDFFITGLPRSGTSLLCNLLHKADNLVIINEPIDIFKPLQADENCVGLGAYYRSLRRAIISGEEVENKITESGDVIEDTRHEDVRRLYSPVISDNNFALGTKNPLAYLARLRFLCDAFPGSLKVVTVRHPLDTIASWKKSFPHLNKVELSQFPFGGHKDSLLDAFQLRELGQIDNAPNLAVKRALLWCYLARLIRRDREKLFIVRYEDLVKTPDKIIGEICTNLSVFPPSVDAFGKVRWGRNLEPLDDEDIEAVSLICIDEMQRWGYDLNYLS